MTRLALYIARRVRNAFGQFNQANDVSTWDGATGCGQTSVQTVLAAFRNVVPTHDAISRVIGYWRPASRVGTSAEQLAKGLAHWGLHYDATYGASFASLLSWASTRGPVLVCVDYATYPVWRLYHGRVSPPPYAQPSGKAGRNQFGTTFTHWVVIAGVVTDGPYAGAVAVMEPNHDSPARRENVVIDYVQPNDLKAAIAAAFPRTVAVVPSHALSIAA